MQMPMGAAQIVFLVITSLVTTYIPHTRVLMMILNTSISTAGMLMVWKLDGQAGRLSGLVLSSVFAVNIPITLSLVSSNVAGFTKRSVTSSMIFVAYCVGNIVGPQFYLSNEAPSYPVRLTNAFLFNVVCMLTIIDWSQICCLRPCPGHLLSDLLACALYLAEQTTRPSLWASHAAYRGRGIGPGSIEPDRRARQELPLYSVIQYERCLYAIYI